MTIRAYTPDDFHIVEQWAKARNMALIPQLLSKNGFLVEDEDGPLAVAWCYLTFDCPRASIDDFYGRPRASGVKLLQAWEIIESAVFSFLRKLQDCEGNPLRYAVLITFADEKLSHFLSKTGWHVGKKPHVQVIKPITYEPD